jgi:hypothetical protein
VKYSTVVHARLALPFSTVLAALLALAWLAYHPGLFGDFLFDDFANLPAIGATGPIDHWSTFFRYITSGTADPTGRPMTLLTFLIDARDWPASPYPFKVTNVILHLINGALLAWVLWWLGRVLVFSSLREGEGKAGIPPRLRRDPLPMEGGENETAAASPPPSAGRGIEGDGSSQQAGIPGRLRRAPLPLEGGENIFWPAIAALYGAGAWLLHPLLVSTTLYIVQREAMLPATFVLIAILGWIASRSALARGHIKRGLAGMAASAWLCTALAVLSKANGALLPLLLLLVEWIVLAPRRPMTDASTHRWYRRAVVVFLVVPSALVIAYLLSLLPGSLAAPIGARGWSTAQRLLTDPRVLTDYLRLLFAPQAHSSGLFNDAFPISTDWLHPASTVPCIVLVVALIGAGFALRKKHPVIALALLFYFTAQLMESGWIPLELYYEHRNYLPAMLLFWPVGIGLTRPGLLRGVRIACAAGIVLTLSVLTFQRATLWGDGLRQARVWAAINPDSARAQANAALYDLAHASPRLAAARLRLSMPKHPDDIQAPINLIGAECKLGRVRSKTLSAAEYALARTRVGGQAAFSWFSEALVMASNHTCVGLDFTALQATLAAARRNPHWRNKPGRQQDLDHLQGQLDLAEGHPEKALASFNRALAAAPKPGPALQQAAYLGSRGYPRLGLAHLDYFATLPPGPKPGIGMPRIHAWVLREQGWWEKETAHLRETLEQDAKAKAAKEASSESSE